MIPSCFVYRRYIFRVACTDRLDVVCGVFVMILAQELRREPIVIARANVFFVCACVRLERNVARIFLVTYVWVRLIC